MTFDPWNKSATYCAYTCGLISFLYHNHNWTVVRSNYSQFVLNSSPQLMYQIPHASFREANGWTDPGSTCLLWNIQKQHTPVTSDICYPIQNGLYCMNVCITSSYNNVNAGLTQFRQLQYKACIHVMLVMGYANIQRIIKFTFTHWLAIVKHFSYVLHQFSFDWVIGFPFCLILWKQRDPHNRDNQTKPLMLRRTISVFLCGSGKNWWLHDFVFLLTTLHNMFCHHLVLCVCLKQLVCLCLLLPVMNEPGGVSQVCQQHWTCSTV